jgi:hypothetical protein
MRMISTSKNFTPIMYADDSSLFFKGTNIDEVLNNINKELKKIVEWLQVNKLSLNIGKSKYIIFTKKKIHKPTVDVMVNNHTIELVTSIKFLGFLLDNHISWKEHIKFITNKISKLTGILIKLKKTLSTEVLLKLYYAYIHSYLVNGIIVWGSATKTSLDPIIKLQKKCIRIISFVSSRTKSIPLFTTLNVLPLNELYYSRIAIFMYKVHHCNHPDIICKLFNKNHGRILRNNHHFIVPASKACIFEMSITVQGCKLYNTLIDTVNFNCSLLTFNKNIKKYFILNL